MIISDDNLSHSQSRIQSNSYTKTLINMVFKNKYALLIELYLSINLFWTQGIYGFPSSQPQSLHSDNNNGGLIIAFKSLSNGSSIIERGNLATFIHWAVLPSKEDSPSTTEATTTAATTTQFPNVEIEELVEDVDVESTAAPFIMVEPTSAPEITMNNVSTEKSEVSTIIPSVSEELMESVIVVNTDQKNEYENSDADKSAVPAAIYVIQRPSSTGTGSGSIGGIIGEALNLAQVAIRVVGVNLFGTALLGGGGGTRLVLFNSTTNNVSV